MHAVTCQRLAGRLRMCLCARCEQELGRKVRMPRDLLAILPREARLQYLQVLYSLLRRSVEGVCEWCKDPTFGFNNTTELLHSRSNTVPLPVRPRPSAKEHSRGCCQT